MTKLKILFDSIKRAKKIIDEQAEEEGLWFIPESVIEAYFQQELRRLHAVIEDIYERMMRC